MQKLSHIISFVLFINSILFSQTSPHGDGFKIECKVCHTTESWKIKDSKFDHSTTDFELVGQHQDVSCKSCHETLKFKEAKKDCENCHIDVHQNSVGTDCERCHTNSSWLVSNVENIHRMSRFPLLGSHKSADCNECHISNSLLDFKPLGVICYDCHISNYQNASKPNHILSNYSTSCEECHSINAVSFSGAGIVHDFFPLVGGHSISDCYSCHQQDKFEGLSPECSSCHIETYNNTTNPSHTSLGFSTDCQECHSISGWQPASFDHDAKFFPIYSGNHNNEWNECSDCHTNSGNYAAFSCVNCHEHNLSETNGDHNDVNGYVYESNACLSCHPTGSENGNFSHTQTFPLIGSHSNVTCSECHETSYTNTSMECSSCHLTDYENAINPNHKTAGISQQCEQCHTSTTWVPSTFNHTTTGFELVGGHLTATCSDCHLVNTSNAVSECNSCHITDYENAINPNHKASGISQQCEQCHTSTTWVPSTFSHTTTGFELVGGHLTATCSDCHSVNTSNAVSECNSCHTTDYENAINPNHKTSGISQQCEQCHNSTTWSPSTFNHTTTGFELVGGHLTATCSDCHSVNTSNAVSECNSCHTTDYENAINPNHKASGISQQCEQCHNSTAWSPSTFNHTTTGFALVGGHSTATCSDCHSVNTSNAVSECFSCHESDFNTAANHISQNYPKDCEMCHNSNSWEETDFDHNSTNFPLTGSHVNAECSNCHTSGYVGTSSECSSCHQTDFDNSINPNHKTVGISLLCVQCHNTTVWVPSTFSHTTTGFELLGSHATVPCSDCHSVNTSNAVSECNSCHITNYENAINPNHKTAGISQQCEQCHNSTTWAPSTFNHTTTGFELVGGHLTATCSDCHSVNTSNAVSECFSCHESNFNTAANHISQNYPKTCEMCHNSNTWEETTFDHNSTNFPLTGSHVNAECNTCHSAGYVGTSSECSSCHQTDFDNSINPNHNTVGISLLCVQCHNTTAWVPSTFSHTTTGFELLGSHATVPCSDCHSVSTSNAVPECFSCHENAYNTAESHLTQSYPKECEMCHNSNTWLETTFDHNATDFPLTGSHTNVDCSNCHASGFVGTNTECSSCHQTDFDNSVNPSHQTLGLSTNCETCHTTNANWEPATFTVHNNYYTLLGAHAAIANNCADCHNGNYTTTPNQCFGCHESEYNATTDPAHLTAQFSIDCEVCHSESAWTPSTFDHDSQYFPIYSGEHRGEWDKCSDCHTTANNYSLFSCIDCHEHNNKTEVDSDHRGVNNYQYVSTACYDCHPKGTEDGLKPILKPTIQK